MPASAASSATTVTWSGYGSPLKQAAMPSEVGVRQREAPSLVDFASVIDSLKANAGSPSDALPPLPLAVDLNTELSNTNDN